MASYQKTEVYQSEIDLTREDLAVLHAIVSADRAVTTSTLREQMHWAETGRQIRYRLDKIEERDLIETWRDKERSPAHQMAVRVAEETEAGASIAAEFEDNPETLPIDERLARVETLLEKMNDNYGKIKRRIVDLEERVNEHDDDLDEIAEDLGRIKHLLSRKGSQR